MISQPPRHSRRNCIPYRFLAAFAALLITVSCKPADPPPPQNASQHAPGENAAPAPVTPQPQAPAPPATSTLQPPAPAEPLPPVVIPADASPETLAKTYFELMQNNRWDAIATIFHPESLAELRNGMDYLQVANESVPAERFRAMVFGVDTSADAVAALPDEQFFAKTLTLLMQGAAHTGALDSRALEVIGSVPEGDDIAHVVTRANIPSGEATFDMLEVVSFKKDGERWKILMTGRMRNNVRTWRTQILGPGN